MTTEIGHGGNVVLDNYLTSLPPRSLGGRLLSCIFRFRLTRAQARQLFFLQLPKSPRPAARSHEHVNLL